MRADISSNPGSAWTSQRPRRGAYGVIGRWLLTHLTRTSVRMILSMDRFLASRAPGIVLGRLGRTAAIRRRQLTGRTNEDL